MTIQKPEQKQGEIYEVKDLVQKLNPHLIRRKIVDLTDGFEVKNLDPKTLVTADRFDLIAKYIYALFWKSKIESDWGTRLYCNHIRAFNSYEERDGSNKIGKNAFLSSFDDLLESIAKNGFSDDFSLVPISSEGVLIDGAHRIAACLAYGQDITCLQINNIISRQYNYSYFLDRGMGTRYADHIAYHYCKLIRNTYIAIIFPKAIGDESKVEEILERKGAIVYAKEIELSWNGLFNLLKQVYENEPWCGDWEDRFKGLREKTDFCFHSKGKTRVLLLESDSLESIREAKEEIRSFFNIGNHSVHINDTHEDARDLAGLLFNENSIHFLNKAKLRNYRENYSLLDEFKNTIKEQNADSESFCIDGSMVMSLYGIRQANDLDFLHHESDHVKFSNPSISDHNAEITHHTRTKDDLIFNSENHFYYRGIKFLSLNNLYSMKLKRGGPKDIEDCRSINDFEERKDNRLIFSVLNTKHTTRAFFKRLIENLKRNIKKTILYKLSKNSFADNRVKMVTKIDRKVACFVDSFKPFVRTVQYKNTCLYYSKGTSIVECHSTHPVRFGGTYEPQETAVIVEVLEKKSSPVFVDIGANIGLISINVLAEVPEVVIHAFEPGVHQYSLLERTIKLNALKNKVFLYQKAVGMKDGKRAFSIHAKKHSSGDGFLDTKRAGRFKADFVDVTTLDTWWDSVGCPRVDMIKMDIEGAELWALAGAEKLLLSCGPTILLEIHPVNLIPYPYSAIDILSLLNEWGYYLKTISGETVTYDNIFILLKHETSFVAAIS